VEDGSAHFCLDSGVDLVSVFLEKPFGNLSAISPRARVGRQGLEKGGPIMITRMILVNVPQERAAEAERMWKQECAPLMIQQPGCLSEQFLRGREDPGEFISLSTWENQAAIDKYRASEAHKAIQQHTRALMNVAKVTVKTYEVMG
jgi:heme-degrading monooxygenase HmoA